MIEQQIFIKFDQDILNETFAPYDTASFTVSWKEYKYVNGPFINKSTTVASIEKTGDNKIIKLNTVDKFNSAVGDITVSYDATVGSLHNRKAVESFTVPFTPTSLVAQINPNAEEAVMATIVRLSTTAKPVISAYGYNGDAEDLAVARIKTTTITAQKVVEVTP